MAIGIAVWFVNWVFSVEGLIFGSGWLKALVDLASLLALIPLAYFLYRGTNWVVEHLLWRLRRRLIVTYFLLGVLPLLLFGALVSLVGFVVIMESSSSLVARQLDGYLEQSRAAATAIGRDLGRLDSGQIAPNQLRQQLQERAEALAPIFPQVSLSVYRPGTPELSIVVTAESGGGHSDSESGARNTAEEYRNGPAWLKARSEFHGLASTTTSSGASEIRAHHLVRVAGAAPTVFQLSYPIGDELTRHLTHITGLSVKPGRMVLPAIVRNPSGDPVIDSRQTEEIGRRASQAATQLGGFPIIMPITDWKSGARLEDQALSVDASFMAPVQIWRRVQQFKTGNVIGEILFALISSLAVIFLLIALVALVSAMFLTRSITGTVHNLYRGTQRIEAGDFDHEIPIRGQDQLSALGVSFNQMTRSVRELLRVSAEKQRLDQEMKIATDVQARLFPRAVPKSDALDVAPGVCIPARSVSGDYYDFLDAGPGLLGIVVADVCGKGVSAALMMANLQANLRGQVLAYLDAYRDKMRLAAPGDSSDPARSAEYAAVPFRVRRIIDRVNRQIVGSMMDANYVTLFYAEFDERSSVLRYTNAGHNPPLLVRCRQNDGGRHLAVERLDRGGTVVGLFREAEYEDVEVRLEGGDLIAAFTDGLVEARSPAGEEFGEQRLISLLENCAHLSAKEVEGLILQTVREWTAGAEQEDDLTFVVLKRK